MNIAVSIIIPVYNAGDFLRKGLDSCVNQTLQNIEIICVNDASTDQSAEVIQEYVNNNGKLSNYHLFNYSIVGEKLCLNENIIIPYQDMDVNDYKHLLTKVS